MSAKPTPHILVDYKLGIIVMEGAKQEKWLGHKRVKEESTGLDAVTLDDNVYNLCSSILCNSIRAHVASP
jgi:hypothetical protein